jgi:hypothetical protein
MKWRNKWSNHSTATPEKELKLCPWEITTTLGASPTQ